MTPNRRPDTSVPPSAYRRPSAPEPDSLRLDGNEGSRPGAELLANLANAGEALLRDYPVATGLQGQIAALHQVAPERVVMGAGADDLIDRCFRAYLSGGRKVIVPVPTFEMVYRLAATAGARLVPVAWNDEFPVDDVIRAIDDATSVVVIVSPNNPTGSTVQARDVRRIADAIPRGLVLFDHVYADYADDDLTSTVSAMENAIVLRTFSKAWGLAGCRVGYGIAASDVAATLRNAGNPYPIAGTSVAVVGARLKRGDESLAEHVAGVRSERTQLTAFLRAHSVRVPASQGNFVFADLEARAGFVYEALRWHGVVVRRFPPPPRNLQRPSNLTSRERVGDGAAHRRAGDVPES